MQKRTRWTISAFMTAGLFLTGTAVAASHNTSPAPRRATLAADTAPRQPEAPAVTPTTFVGPVVWPTPGVTYKNPGFGWHDCGVIVGQQAFSIFYGPDTHEEPDGTQTVRGEVVTSTGNGGCGVSATYELQTKVCKKHLFVTTCHWSDVAKAKAKSTDLPVNGKRDSDLLVAPLRKGVNTYRIEATVHNLKNLEAESGRPGIIGLTSQEIDQISQEAKLPY